MADIKDYNNVAADYRKRLQNPNWEIDKKKAKEFSKGASESGELVAPEVKKKLKGFFGLND